MFGHQRQRTSATEVGISPSICTTYSSCQMKAFVYISFFFFAPGARLLLLKDECEGRRSWDDLGLALTETLGKLMV